MTFFPRYGLPYGSEWNSFEKEVVIALSPYLYMISGQTKQIKKIETQQV
jgi:hypothetical protein